MQKAYVNQATPASHMIAAFNPLMTTKLSEFLWRKILNSKYHCHYISFYIYTEVWTSRIGKFTQEWQSRRKWARDFTEFLTLSRYGNCGRCISDFAWKQNTSYSLHLLHYVIWSNVIEHSVLWAARVLVTTCSGKDSCCSKFSCTSDHMITWNFCSFLFYIKYRIYGLLWDITVFCKTMTNICPFVICFLTFIRRTKLILSKHIQDSCEINCCQIVIILNAWSKDQQLLNRQKFCTSPFFDLPCN